MKITAWNVRNETAGLKEYGPFTGVQVTYDLLRVDPGDDRELAFFNHDSDIWRFDDGFEASDFYFTP